MFGLEILYLKENFAPQATLGGALSHGSNFEKSTTRFYFIENKPKMQKHKEWT